MGLKNSNFNNDFPRIVIKFFKKTFLHFLEKKHRRCCTSSGDEESCFASSTDSPDEEPWLSSSFGLVDEEHRLLSSSASMDWDPERNSPQFLPVILASQITVFLNMYRHVLAVKGATRIGELPLCLEVLHNLFPLSRCVWYLQSNEETF